MEPSESQANIERYVYGALLTPMSIRLLRRLGKDSYGRLNFSMHTVDLREYPYYHCLSYTWGNPHADGTPFRKHFQDRAPEYGTSYEVLVNGKLLEVGKNLHDAIEQPPTDCWARRVKQVYENLDGQLSIHISAKLGDLNVLWSDLQHGANPSARDVSGKTLVHYAAMYGKLEAVKMLVDAGADVTIKDDEGKMPIAYAWEKKDKDTVHYLVECMMVGSTAMRKPLSKMENSFDDLIWIDALCINQEDLQERTAQVAIMDQIYERAGYVLAWLGEEDFSTATGVETVKKIAAACDDFEKSSIIPYESCDESEYKKEGLPSISLFEWNSLAAIFARQWFRRIWVVQEIVFAADLILYSGKHELTLTDLSRVCGVLTALNTKLGYESSMRYIPIDEIATSLEYFYQRILEIRDERMLLVNDWTRADGVPVGQRLLLRNLVASTFPFHASDPRDKVFALAALLTLHPDRRDVFRADYAMSVEQCYTWVTVELIQRTGDLGVLSWVQDISVKKLPNLPTWVPDYSVRGTSPLRSNSFNVFPASQQRPLRLDLPAPNSFVLGFAGLEWDTVRFVGGPKQPKFKLDPSWFSLVLNLCVTYHTGQRRSEVLWRTLCADQDVHGKQPAPPNLQHSFKSLICALMCGKAEKRLGSHLSFFSGICQLAHHLNPTIDEESGDVAEEVRRMEAELRNDTRLASDWFDFVKPTLQNLVVLSFTEIQPPGCTPWSCHTPTPLEVERFFQESQLGSMPEASVTLEEREGSQTFVMRTGGYEDTPEGTTAAIAAQALGPFGRAYSRAYSGRRLFVTRKRYFGLGPASLEVGDSVFLLSGAKVPFILRPIAVEERPDNARRAFHLVGEAYVHGIMHGEAFAAENNVEPDLEEVDLV